MLPKLYIPVSGFVVTPVLGWWRRPSPVDAVDPAETARVFRVPVADLTDPANRATAHASERLPGPGVPRRGRSGLGFHRRTDRPDPAPRGLGTALGPGAVPLDWRHDRLRPPSGPADRTDLDDGLGTPASVPVNVLDILLLLAAVWFAVIGYRQGFVVGILSVFGFLGGGLIAVYLLPIFWDKATGPRRGSGHVRRHRRRGDRHRDAPRSVRRSPPTSAASCARRITWSPARAVDATGGALVNVLSMLLVAWLIGSALAGTALPTIGREVRSSKVLTGVSQMVPARADSWFADFSSVLAQNGFPQVFSAVRPASRSPASRRPTRSCWPTAR